MMDWFKSRTSREQTLLLAAVALLLALAVFQFVHRPLTDYRAAAEARHEAAAARLAGMTTLAAEARGLLAAGEPATRGSTGPVRAIATSSAQAMGINVTRLQPGEDNSVTLWVEGVETQRLYEWLARLRETEGVVVGKASLTADDATPTIRAQLRLTAARSGE